MGLELTGELLAVTTQRVEAPEGAKWESFDSTNVLIFDEGRTVECKVGRDMPGRDVAHLRQHQSDRPHVRLAVFLSKGRFYAERVIESTAAEVKSA